MDNKAWAKEVAKKIKEKELAVAKRNVGKVPYTAENGVFNIALVRRSVGGPMVSGAA